MVEQMNCNPNWITWRGYTCLSLACIHNNVDVILYLIKDYKSHGCQYKSENLVLACRNQSLSVIKCLIDDCKLDVNHIGENGSTCLSMACWSNPDLSVIKYLVEECKLDPNHQDDDTNSCLRIAWTRNGNKDVAMYLMGLPGIKLSRSGIPLNKWQEIIQGLSTGR
jgi:ankyrin repeat protein